MEKVFIDIFSQTFYNFINIQKQISWEQVYRVNLTFNRKTRDRDSRL